MTRSNTHKAADSISKGGYCPECWSDRTALSFVNVATGVPFYYCADCKASWSGPTNAALDDLSARFDDTPGAPVPDLTTSSVIKTTVPWCPREG